MKATVTPFKGISYFKGPEEWRTCPAADEKPALKKRGWEGQRDLEKAKRPHKICSCKLTESPALQGLSSKNEARAGHARHLL